MTSMALQVAGRIAEACNTRGKAPSLFTVSREEFAQVQIELFDYVKGDSVWLSGVKVVPWNHPIGPVWEETHGV